MGLPAGDALGPAEPVQVPGLARNAQLQGSLRLGCRRRRRRQRRRQMQVVDPSVRVGRLRQRRKLSAGRPFRSEEGVPRRLQAAAAAASARVQDGRGGKRSRGLKGGGVLADTCQRQVERGYEGEEEMMEGGIAREGGREGGREGETERDRERQGETKRKERERDRGERGTGRKGDRKRNRE